MKSLLATLLVFIFIISCEISPKKTSNTIENSIHKIKVAENKNVIEMYILADQLKKHNHKYATFFSKLYTTKAKYLQYPRKEYLKTFDSLYEIAKKIPEIEFTRFEIDEIIIDYYYSRSDYKNASERLKTTFDYIFQDRFNFRKDIFINKILHIHSYTNKDERFMNSKKIIAQIRDSTWNSDSWYLYKALAINFIMQNDDTQAKKILTYAYKESEKKGFTFLQADALFLYAKLLPDNLRNNHYKILDSLIQKTGRIGYSSNIYRNMGHSYTHLNMYDKGLEYYKKAIKIDSLVEDTITMGYNLTYAGWAYDLIHNDPKNEPNLYHKKALSIAKDNDFLLKRLIYERLTWAFSKGKNYKKVEEYQTKLIQSLEKENENFELFEDVYANTLIHTKNKDFVIHNLKIESQLFEYRQENNRIIIVSLLIFIGVLSFSLIRIRKRNIYLNELNNKSNTINQQNIKLNSVINELKQSNTELENFASIVAHDIKTPLGNIQSFANFIEEENTNNTESKIHTEYILESCKYLTDLINGVLSYSSINKNLPTPKKVDINVMLKQILDKYNPIIIKKNITILMSDNLPIIYVHEILIQQLFKILIENSLQQIEGVQNPIFEISYNPKNKLFTFQDNGKAISKEIMENMFDSYTKHSHSKRDQINSIRLATLDKILKVYQGEIHAKSTSKYNNSIIFSIPNYKQKTMVV